MGNKPSGNISIVAMRENASRGGNKEKFPLAFKALTLNSYVDNTFITASNHQELDEAIQETEQVANSGGFYYKEWPCSGKISPSSVTVASSQLEDTGTGEKALGLRWETKTDMLYIKVDVAKAPKKVRKKNDYSVIVEKSDQILVSVKPKLTVRMAL